MKIPKPEKLPSGSYRVRLRLDGQSVSITKPTEREAIREAELIKAQHRNDIKTRPTGGNVPLHAAIDDYISSRENVLSPATIRGYRVIQKYRFQTYTNRPIGSINWQRAVNEESRLVSAKTLKNSWGFVRSVLMENGLDVSVRLPAVPVAEKEWLTPEQIPVFLEAVKGQPCEIPALLALSSLRRSEIFALDWQDIDLRNRVIHVRGAMTIDESNSYVLRDQTKTASSTRAVPIFIDQLYRALSAVENKTGAVVSSNPSTPFKQIRSVCARAGLPNPGVHGLRHSFASLCYHLGINEMTAMEIGGWSDFQTMRKIYTHLSEIDRMKNADKLADFFKNAHGNAHDISKS